MRKRTREESWSETVEEPHSKKLKFTSSGLDDRNRVISFLQKQNPHEIGKTLINIEKYKQFSADYWQKMVDIFLKNSTPSKLVYLGLPKLPPDPMNLISFLQNYVLLFPVGLYVPFCEMNEWGLQTWVEIAKRLKNNPNLIDFQFACPLVQDLDSQTKQQQFIFKLATLASPDFLIHLSQSNQNYVHLVKK